MKTTSKKLPAVFNLPIVWTDEDWAKPLVFRSTKKACVHPGSSSPARGIVHRCVDGRRGHRGFTLIEMLVVIAIIAILAGILVPVLGRAKDQAKVTTSRTDMKNIEAAISSYQATYTLPPLPKPNPYNPPAATDFSFTQTNSDIIAILMDQNVLANTDHARNPQKQSFLNANIKPGTGQGVSSDDYNFRDPWGNEYVIAFDLNYDNKVFVENGTDPEFSQYPLPPSGIPRSVVIWSRGRDGQAEQRAANGSDREGLNKDNIRGWE